MSLVRTLHFYHNPTLIFVHIYFFTFTRFLLFCFVVLMKDKWIVVKDGKEQLELVIVDYKVVIPTTYKALYDQILNENNTCTLNDYQIGANDLLFKAYDHKYRLKWTSGTTSINVNVHDILNPLLKFKPFSEIIYEKWRVDLLVHVIGVVQDMSYCQLHEGIGKKLQVNFTLRDLSVITLNCTP
ncbi:hypothetical protein MtrunA17_Chr4g0026601 [Medicago truncatula]|uniref:Nucleic acid-binding protein n=1 Tax=Medicago truncatula TaxID=3880 RepID=A0A396I6R5_MEDTR|nr:hypothetical protein MtrunA17_Chr4g0026601 [Medicago truncatula]